MSLRIHRLQGLPQLSSPRTVPPFFSVSTFSSFSASTPFLGTGKAKTPLQRLHTPAFTTFFSYIAPPLLERGHVLSWTKETEAIIFIAYANSLFLRCCERLACILFLALYLVFPLFIPSQTDDGGDDMKWRYGYESARLIGHGMRAEKHLAYSIDVIDQMNAELSSRNVCLLGTYAPLHNRTSPASTNDLPRSCLVFGGDAEFVCSLVP